MFVSLFVCVITFGLLFGQHYKCLTSVPEGGFGSTDLGEKCEIGSRYLKALLSFPGSWILSLSWEIGSQYLKVPTIFPRSWTLSLSDLVEKGQAVNPFQLDAEAQQSSCSHMHYLKTVEELDVQPNNVLKSKLNQDIISDYQNQGLSVNQVLTFTPSQKGIRE